MNWDCDPIFPGNIQTCCGREFLSESTCNPNRKHRHMGRRENQKHREVNWLGKATEHVRGRDEHWPLLSWRLKTFLSSTNEFLDSTFLLVSQNTSTESVVHEQVGLEIRTMGKTLCILSSSFWHLGAWPQAHLQKEIEVFVPSASVCPAGDSIKQHKVCKSDTPPSLQCQVGIYNSRPYIPLPERSIVWGLTDPGFYSAPKWKHCTRSYY